MAAASSAKAWVLALCAAAACSAGLGEVAAAAAGEEGRCAGEGAEAAGPCRDEASEGEESSMLLQVRRANATARAELPPCECMGRWYSAVDVARGYAACLAVLGCPEKACDNDRSPWCYAREDCQENEATFPERLTGHHWFYCTPPNPATVFRRPEKAEAGCRTAGSPSHRCQFPFRYKEKMYFSCTTVDDATPWCATVQSERGVEEHDHWGYCREDDCDGLCDSPLGQHAQCGSLEFAGPAASVAQCKRLMRSWGGDVINYAPENNVVNCFVRKCGRDANLGFKPSGVRLTYADQCKDGRRGRNAVAAPATREAGPLIWVTSGGGSTAEAGAMGFAHAFHKVGLFERSDFAAVASNSGGSWFNFMFHYNSGCFEAVTGTLQALLKFADVHFTHEVDVMTEAGRADPDTDPASKFLFEVGRAFGNFFFKELFATNGWRDLIVDIYGPSNPNGGVPDIPADGKGRVGFTKHALRIQSNLLTMPWMADLGARCGSLPGNCPPVDRTTLFGSDGKSLVQGPRGEVVNLIPVQYFIPGSSSPAGSKAGIEVAESNYFDYGIAGGGSQTFRGGGGHKPVRLPRQPSLIDVVAWTSAAAAFLNSDTMLNDIVGHFFEAFSGYTLPALLKAALDLIIDSPRLMRRFAAMSICASPTTAEGFCPWASLKFADGGVSDNLGFAQTLAAMQREHPGKTLRFVVTENQNGAHVEIPDLLEGIDENKFGKRFDASFLFQPAVRTNEWELVRALGAALPVPWVLAQPGGRPLQWKTAFPGDETGFKVRFVEVSTETVYNAQFGVLAGTPVELLLFAVDGGEILPLTSTAADYKQLIEIVASKAGVAEHLSRWLGGPGGR